MSSSPEQELCIATVDSPEPIEVCCHEEEESAQEELELTTEQATDADTGKQAPHCDPQESTATDPVTVPKPCIPPCKCKVLATPQPQRSRIPKAVFQYYLQFGFTPKAVEAILHSPPGELTNKKVSFVPTTPPKNC